MVFWRGIFLLLGLLLGANLFAYANFVAYGYKTCQVCHYNPLGNGPLTEYGRALGATTISGKPFWGKYSEEELGMNSGFLEFFKERIRMGANYRGLYFLDDLNTNPQQKYVHMKGELSAALLLNGGKWVTVANLGYAPPPRGQPDAPVFISREHYTGVHASDNIGVYAGLMDIAYGIRIPDHIAFSRSYTELKQNDQAHGLLFHYHTKDWEFAINPFGGNLYQDAAKRQLGASATGEIDLGDRHRLGLSLLYSKSDIRSRMLASLHSKISFYHGVGILSELGFVRKKQAGGDEFSLGVYYWGQSTFRIFRGFHTLMTLEYGRQDLKSDSPNVFRLGPSIQYFPFQRLELRGDLLFTRNFGVRSSGQDSFTILGQVNVWL